MAESVSDEDSQPSGSGVDADIWSDSDSEVDAHLHARGEFFGCYLLISRNENPRLKGQTYIGFTVDPNRRLRQHNCGLHKGGARKTSGKGPWDMILIVHGFPNHISALRFEWAWQNPARSRRLGKGVARKRRTESAFQYRFRVLTEMLSVGPWNRLPLTIRWLRQEYQLQFPPDKQPPLHMPIAYGLVGLSKTKQDSSHSLSQPDPSGGVAGGGATETLPQALQDCRQDRSHCHLCKDRTRNDQLLQCYHKQCTLCAHVTCLAPKLLSGGRGAGDQASHLIPVCGVCPRCGEELLWGELVRRLQAIERRGDVTRAPPTRKRKALPSSQPPSRRQRRAEVGTARSHWSETLHVHS